MGQIPVVLVVEDEPLVRTLTCDIVERAGFEAVEASDADQAIGILETRDDVRLVFTDIEMPGTMDGVKLAHYIRDRWPPILLVLGSSQAVMDETALPAGSKAFTKPYDEALIASTLRRMLGRTTEDPAVTRVLH